MRLLLLRLYELLESFDGVGPLLRLAFNERSRFGRPGAQLAFFGPGWSARIGGASIWVSGAGATALALISADDDPIKK